MEDGRTVTKQDIQAVAQWLKTKTSDREIAFPGRGVDAGHSTGVPCSGRPPAMRDAMEHLGGDPRRSTRWCLWICHRSFGRGKLNFFGTQGFVKKKRSKRNNLQNQETL